MTGFSLGFGYNKSLRLPEAEAVPEFPLIRAAEKGFDSGLLTELKTFIQDEGGQDFLTAGIKFQSFQLIRGCLLLTAAFGRELEFGILGSAEVSVPPKASSRPVARAVLSIKASYAPAKGFVKAEACLAADSYIFSENCRLTGGFAAYCWLAGSGHEGDFVVSLGGYHPSYKKPEHYPEVPRLGLDWPVSKNLNITGEMYFAVTPSALMAGGRLSAVYTAGKLKAWFVACADFLMNWKPFHYCGEIGVTLGASCRVDVWFVHKTFSVEMAANLKLWGPEVQGRLHISWFILSFTIAFSCGKDYSGETLDWQGFRDSFLYGQEAPQAVPGENAGSSGVLNISLENAAGFAPDGLPTADVEQLSVVISSKIPETGNVRPLNGASLQAPVNWKIQTNDVSVGGKFAERELVQKVPAALWGKKQNDPLEETETLLSVSCGRILTLAAGREMPVMFPKEGFFSLESLYQQNTLFLGECFCFGRETAPMLSAQNSIAVFSQNAASPETAQRRQQFLKEHGISDVADVSVFAAEAENWLAEEILIAGSDSAAGA